jgi:hypothetical protein
MKAIYEYMFIYASKGGFHNLPMIKPYTNGDQVLMKKEW